MARFQVSGTNTATGLHFQAAVPKVRVALKANDDVSVTLIGFLGAVTTAACDRSSRGKSLHLVDRPPDGELTRVSPTKSSLRLRLRVAFTLAGQAIQDQVDFSGFPPGLTGSV